LQSLKYMYKPLFSFIVVSCLCSCNNGSQSVRNNEERQIVSEGSEQKKLEEPRYKTIGTIPVPDGYKRSAAPAGSFTHWLRQISFKEDKTVYLWNGKIKPNQSAQYAVLDVSTGKKDLQQCADVVMRLRAEYLFAQKQYSSISFADYNGKKYNWQGGGNRAAFDKYLENVFGWCGSASLEKQLKPVADIKNLQPGDVFIWGGFPGHAVIVTDMATDNKGNKIYMLVQGYQPAQDMHLLVNPVNTSISPWYEVNEEQEIITPEWKFTKDQLKRW
jgi:Domain of unknown function (4846)